MQDVPDIAIVGPGRVGVALGMLAARAGLNVRAVAGRDASAARTAAGRIGAGVRACDPGEAAGSADLVLLTVPDDAIADVCARLAEAGAFRRGAVVAHCSGGLDSSVLAPARNTCGCAIGSMHPLQTFPTADAAVERLPGSYCFIEGDERAAGTLEQLARAIGANPVPIDPPGKALHHTAAVTACNYLVTLLDAAGRLAETAGVDPETYRRALEPLMRTTLDNALSMGPERALTGPIVRGDVDTVRRHLAAIAGLDENTAALYRAAGRCTIDLAVRSGRLDERRANDLRDLLKPETGRNE